MRGRVVMTRRSRNIYCEWLRFNNNLLFLEKGKENLDRELLIEINSWTFIYGKLGIVNYCAVWNVIISN